MRLNWPLTGRAEELHIIDAALSAPDLSGIVICGPTGVGKSRLAREALAVAASRGCVARWAAGTSSAREIPVGAFNSWARPRASDTPQLVRGVIAGLTSARGDETVVVGVDDTHLLDDLSTFVVHQIVQRCAAKVVLTVRDGDPIPVATQEIWQAGQFDRLDLQPLSRAEAATLVSDTLGGPLEPNASERLWKLTRGNVLYLRNIVEHEFVGGRLAMHDGFWRWTGDPVVPPGLVELIEARIGSLSPSVADVIDALAIGEPIELAPLVKITGRQAVEEADTRRLITVDRVGDRVEARVSHPMYAEVRRERAPITKLRRLRGLLATELEASADHDDMRVIVRRAALSLDSELEPDPELLVRAAQGALAFADLALADRLAEAAIRAGAGAEAYVVRLHALAQLGRGVDADAVLADIPTTEFTDADHAMLILLRAQNMLWTLADPDGAKKLVDQAAQAIRVNDRGCIDAFHAAYWAAMGKPEFVRQVAPDALRDGLPSYAAAVKAWAVTVAAGDAGRTAEALSAADAGYVVSANSYDAALMQFVIGDAHVRALLQSGRIHEAADVSETLRRNAADLPGVPRLLSDGVWGQVSLTGRLDVACSRLGDIVETLTASGDVHGWLYRYRLPYTIALAMRGLTDAASTALAALEAESDAAWRCVDYERELAQAWIAAAQGAVTDAIAAALSAAEISRANGQFAAEVTCLQTVVQFGDHSPADRLRELEAIVEGPRVCLAARFAVALRADDGTELSTVAEEFEGIGDLVPAVDAASHAAIAFRHQGLRGSETRCVGHAQLLAEKCGGPITPALRQAVTPLPLTSRELEVVMLLGEGLSIRAIAERLVISARTVEGHIYRAMAKTGASSRDELIALLPRHQIPTAAL